MWHPVHLHGHTFQVIRAEGSAEPRKDTVVVKPRQIVVVRLAVANAIAHVLRSTSGRTEVLRLDRVAVGA